MARQGEHDPERIGHYDVVRCLGEGAFGRTFLVNDHREQEKTPLALKWLKDGAEAGADRRFENEAWALEHLKHPAFPRLVQRGAERGRPFLVMTFAEGLTVGDRIAENVKVGTTFSAGDVILYASPKAPGARTVSQKVEQGRGDVTVRDGVDARHLDVFQRHLALWNLYLFVRPDLADDRKQRLAFLMERRFGLKDAGDGDHKQLALRI